MGVPLSSDISNIIMLFKENNCRKYFIASLSLLINNVLCKSSNRQMTVVIDAGDDYCFFVPNITTGQNFDFDFEVTESSGAEGVNDISVRIQSPQPENKIVYSVERENEGSHSEEAHMNGDYQICLDNRMSTFAEKIVSFELMINDPTDDYYDDYIDSEEMNEMRGRNEDYEGTFNMTTDELKNYIHKVRLNLGKVKHFQFMQGADMSRDTHNVMRMIERLDLWSLIHVAIMMVIGLTQIYMVRQLFEEKSLWHRFSKR